MIYLTLFCSFFKIGLFSIGGGYAALPLIQEEVIANKAWLTLGEFTDLLTISTMTPGPIAINASTFVGTKVAGLPGAIIATIGCVTPSCILVITLAYFYYKYNNLSIVKKILETLRPVVVALIGAAGASIVITAFWGKEILNLANINKTAVGIFLVSYFLLSKFKISSVFIILLSGVAGVFLYGGI